MEVWRSMPVVPAFWMLRQEDSEFNEEKRGYLANPYLINEKESQA